VIPSDVFLITQEEQLASLALHHRIPAVSQTRAFTVAGGLMSYAGSTLDDYRQAGVYTGRVLKGEKPADLPVQQTTKVELIVNLRTAPPDIGAGLAPRGDKARAVAHQSAGRDILAKRMDRGHLVARCQRGDLLAPGE
jgi:hypothetical protein